MKKCLRCGKYNIKNNNHDVCYDCWKKLQDEESQTMEVELFEENLTNKIPTVYIMKYGDKRKIGYTNDLNSRLFEIKQKYPDNKLLYFREFLFETEARKFEKWLKKLYPRDIYKFISNFQDKVKKVEHIM